VYGVDDLSKCVTLTIDTYNTLNEKAVALFTQRVDKDGKMLPVEVRFDFVLHSRHLIVACFVVCEIVVCVFALTRAHSLHTRTHTRTTDDGDTVPAEMKVFDPNIDYDNTTER